jgi:hypothetical protein
LRFELSNVKTRLEKKIALAIFCYSSVFYGFALMNAGRFFCSCALDLFLINHHHSNDCLWRCFWLTLALDKVNLGRSDAYVAVLEAPFFHQ